MSNSEILWTVARQDPLSLGILQGRIPEWVAIPSSRGSSLPRDRTHAYYVSCIALRFFATSTTWEAQVGVLRDCKDRKKLTLLYSQTDTTHQTHVLKINQ